MARLNEKLIPYQNENLSKFAEQYKNKEATNAREYRSFIP